jgi:hypothetical protein
MPPSSRARSTWSSASYADPAVMPISGLESQVVSVAGFGRSA